MRRSRAERSLAHGQEKDHLLVMLLKHKAPYEEIKHALLNLERRWLREATTEAERQQTQRGIAEDILSEAFAFSRPWAEFGRWLRRVQQLGFSNLALRVHIACMFVQSLHLFPRKSREAWELLEDAEKRVLRLRRKHPLRKEHLEALAHAKKVARVPRPSPR
jgi:hypothetical protein